jgi:acyl-CoA synthetase (AMP-forming)/AMP-acid ligase II
MSATLRDLLPVEQAKQPALIVPETGQTWRYADLQEQTARLAEALRRGGVRAGDVVALVLPNSPELVSTFLAVTGIGALAAPLNPAYKVEEFRFYFQDMEVNSVLVSAGDHPAGAIAAKQGISLWEVQSPSPGRLLLERRQGPPVSAAPDRPPQPDDVALLLHTSGTTSRPKRVPLTHANLLASVSNIARHYRLGPEDASLVVMPLFHVHGLIGATLSTLYTGGRVLLPARFSASQFWVQAQHYQATWYSAVPTIHQILLSRAEAEGVPRHSFRFLRSCSAALPPAVAAQLEQRFGAPVVEAYGMTEAAHQMASNPLPPAVHKFGTVGLGTGVALAIVDEAGRPLPAGAVGEVAVRGPNVMRGYLRDPAATAQAFTAEGYFRTGDLGRLDAEGYLTLLGRIKELINRGGEKISPLEIDAVLLAHPAVAEAVCFGVPDAKYGEEVQAAVVLKGQATVQELQDFCRERLADFKVPKTIYLTDQLPRTATGKIQRRLVAAHFTAS